ncbi:MAG: cell division protein SepF [Candidatus Ancillula trichonymphae]|jgi:cell division inhibitor SepF|nr:cell division protein SepF [Candidatus Ancillula trichonymphae]
MANVFTKAAKWLGVVAETEEDYYDDDYGYGGNPDNSTALRAQSVVSRPKVGNLHSIAVLHPQSFTVDARAIGEAFRDGTTTLINLSDLADPDAQRIVDFASGLAFAVDGDFNRVDRRVFLLTHKNSEVISDSAPPSATTDFYNHN